MGTAAYTYHAGEVMKTLAQAKPGGTYEIRDWSKLELLARAAGVELEPKETLAKRVADTVWAEFNRDHHEESPLVAAFAPAPRVEAWRKLGVMPGGVLHENNRCTTSCMTNIDGDYLSLAVKAMRLGIATAYGAQVPLELAQDALFGTPTPHAIKVDLGILDPAYVNIVVNGHEPMLGAALIDAAHAEAAQARAREAGAKGLRIVGSIETGQELVQRFAVDDVFVGLTGNWLNQEMAVATGAIDVFAADMNCTVPTLAATCTAHGCAAHPGQRPDGHSRRRAGGRVRSGQGRPSRRRRSSAGRSATTRGAPPAATASPRCAPATRSPDSRPRASWRRSAARSIHSSTSSRRARCAASPAW